MFKRTKKNERLGYKMLIVQADLELPYQRHVQHYQRRVNFRPVLDYERWVLYYELPSQLQGVPCEVDRYGSGAAKKKRKAGKKNEELEREIEALKANVDFLSHSFSSSHDDHPRSFPLFSDVALVASDDSPDAPIPANKFVLASHSPVFKAMLETAMEESISGIIKMSDVTYGSLHAFVKYLYTADVCLDVKIASDLLILAEKYQVKHLKEHCERYLVSNLNWDNSILNYVFACKHSAGKLLEASLSIITNNMDKFMNTNEYGEIIRKDLSLLVGIFEAYMIKQVKNGV
ncbi:hypothetical protein Dimus_036350 [Dionaea muscipula]